MNNKSKPKIFLAALAAAAGLASSSPTKGSPVLDANYTPNSSGGNIIVAQRLSVAQTFTVLSTGTMTSAAVNLAAGSPNANLVFEIRTLSGGLPSEATSGPTVLAASVLSPVGLTTSFNWVTFNFTGFRRRCRRTIGTSANVIRDCRRLHLEWRYRVPRLAEWDL